MRAYLLIVSLLGLSVALPAKADTNDYTKGTCVHNSAGTSWLHTTADTWEDCHQLGWWLLTPAEIDALMQSQQGNDYRPLTEDERKALLMLMVSVIGLAGVYRYAISVLRNQR